MIKANELRLGNWIYCVWSKSNVIVSIDRLKSVDIWNKSEEDTQYNPIPLTAEILEKAGFIKEECPNWNEIIWIKGLIELDKTDAGLVLKNPVAPIVHHLHQLQNLYFALTGEELNIEL